MDLLIAEELLLLGYTPKGKPLVNLELLDYTLSAGVLAELMILSRIELRDGRIVVTDSAPAGDTELDQTLDRLSMREQPPPFEDWWPVMYTPERRVRLLERLARRGAITAETRTYLKLIKEELFPEADPAARESVRRRVLAALEPGAAEPDRRTVALVSLAHAARLVAKALPKADRRRAAELAARDRLGGLVAVAFEQAAGESVGKLVRGGGLAG
ncbi:GPP34 family phosphoprotein [Nonomuraea sp. NPDC050202]|uniref:GOLPH3/VPS74 family protein n=1 Tax=Nonomuraea sp. NPDC050202 TaxID=3155035 RepID=UPI0033D303F2